MHKMQSFDMFAHPIPSFNFRGQEAIPTKIGAFCSLIIAIVVFYYALLKSIKLYQRSNPTIASYDIRVERDLDSHPIDLLENLTDFKLAFNFYYESPDEFKVLDDRRFLYPIV